MTRSGVSKTSLKRSIRLVSLWVMIPAAITMVLFVSSVFLLFIPSMEKQMMAQQQKMIHNLIDTCWSLLSAYQDRVESEELSLEEAQARAIERIHGMRYGPGGRMPRSASPSRAGISVMSI